MNCVKSNRFHTPLARTRINGEILKSVGINMFNHSLQKGHTTVSKIYTRKRQLQTNIINPVGN